MGPIRSVRHAVVGTALLLVASQAAAQVTATADAGVFNA